MHESVLLKEAVEGLNLKKDSVVVDCTLGYGGHSSTILKQIPSGHLYAFDQDEEAIKYSQNRLSQIGLNFTIIYSNFVNLKNELAKRNIEKVDAILFDLGVSSPQLDEEERGFSFHKDARLDMRMDKQASLDAYQVVNTYPKEKLIDIFYQYGEEKYAKSIASNIVKKRMEKPITTTLELTEIIKESVPFTYKKNHHPARKVFQAIRIEVNHELEVFSSALADALEILKPQGRLAVITFHSLEDRICKQTFKEVSEIDSKVKGLPFIPEEYQKQFKVIANIKPSLEEQEKNKRSRSARLRILERI